MLIISVIIRGRLRLCNYESKIIFSETCKEKQHKKVLDKGKPEDVMPGILGIKESLPTQPLSGMLNKQGGKVRLTFKLENDQVWIGKHMNPLTISKKRTSVV